MKKIIIFIVSVLIFSSCEFIMNNDEFDMSHNPATPATETDYVILESDGFMVQKNDLSNGADWETAKIICENSRVGGFSDWRLPTKAELAIMYNKRKTIGNFSADTYWSSEKKDETYYWCYSFYYGIADYAYNRSLSCRAVRSLP